MTKKMQAWKSTVLGLLLIIGLGLGVYTKVLTEAFLLAMVPSIYLVFSDVFKEKKKDE